MSPGFGVVAIIAAYNEADIIDAVVGDLIQQGVHVYFLDDGSTDQTVAIVEKHLGRGVLAIDRLTPPGDASRPFEWERILLRKAQLARELDADWFIHHDADEFREGPWASVPLLDAIRRVDALGFNAIDFASLDFLPVQDNFRAGDDVRDVLTSYAEPAPYDRLQIRCWKKAGEVDLASTGGHEARFPGRSVFPLRFISRHYPIRGQAHGERKVFRERQSRFTAQERERGWHVQYDGLRAGASFLRDPSTLIPYDPDAVRLALTLRHRGVEALEASLGEAQSEAETHRRDLEQRGQELARAESALAEARTQLAGVQAALVRTREELGARISELAVTVDARSAELADVRSELSVRTDDLVARQGELAAQRAELAMRTGELAVKTGALDARTTEAAALRRALDERLSEIERWRATVEDQARRVDALHHSLSWRWTAPARGVYRLLTGR